MKEFWWKKNWDDVNWLSTLKQHLQFESCQILKFQESFNTFKWGVMYMTLKKKSCSLWNNKINN
jgi:hypothetical protein